MENGIPTDQLPFVKGIHYEDDVEFRVIYFDEQQARNFVEMPIDHSAIGRIVLSPWVPQTLANPVRESIQSIEGCENLEVVQSTVIESENWKKVAKPTLELIE